MATALKIRPNHEYWCKCTPQTSGINKTVTSDWLDLRWQLGFQWHRRGIELVLQVPRLFHSATIFCCYICTCICCLKLHRADYQVGEGFFFTSILHQCIYYLCRILISRPPRVFQRFKRCSCWIWHLWKLAVVFSFQWETELMEHSPENKCLICFIQNSTSPAHNLFAFATGFQWINIFLDSPLYCRPAEGRLVYLQEPHVGDADLGCRLLYICTSYTGRDHVVGVISGSSLKFVVLKFESWEHKGQQQYFYCESHICEKINFCSSFQVSMSIWNRTENHLFMQMKYNLTGIILGIGSASERCYIVTPPVIGWVHTQNGPCSSANG